MPTPLLKTENADAVLPLQATVQYVPDGSGGYEPASAGSGGGDASAANQTSQIAVETAIRDRVGATTDAEATGDGSLIALAKRLRTLLGSLATIATNTAVQFGSGVLTSTTQRVTLATDGSASTNLGTIATNTTGAATAENQSTANGSLSTIATNTAPRSTDYGLLSFRNTSLSNTALAVKASAGNIFGIRVINPNSNSIFVKLYDVAAGSVVVGTTAVQSTTVVPGGTAANPGMVWITPNNLPIFARFATAIAVAATGSLADADTSAPTTAAQISILYV